MDNELDQIDKGKDKDFILTAIIVAFLIISAWFVTLFVLREKPNRGTFGDMFGSINALFSGLALAGIILTILLQRRDLAYQRKDLAIQLRVLNETKDELKRTAIAQEKSEIALNRQAENLKISAELTALNTLVNYYYDEVKFASSRGLPTTGSLHAEKEKYVKRIKEILERKQE